MDSRVLALNIRVLALKIEQFFSTRRHPAHPVSVPIRPARDTSSVVTKQQVAGLLTKKFLMPGFYLVYTMVYTSPMKTLISPKVAFLQEDMFKVFWRRTRNYVSISIVYMWKAERRESGVCGEVLNRWSKGDGGERHQSGESAV